MELIARPPQRFHSQTRFVHVKGKLAQNNFQSSSFRPFPSSEKIFQQQQQATPKANNTKDHTKHASTTPASIATTSNLSTGVTGSGASSSWAKKLKDNGPEDKRRKLTQRRRKQKVSTVTVESSLWQSSSAWDAQRESVR
jgi:hypothetical protein